MFIEQYPMHRLISAEGETRTLMPLRALRPEHSVSTNFTTSAGAQNNIKITNLNRSSNYMIITNVN